jgi:hypothetical protein
MQWLFRRGANRAPKMEKHLSLTSVIALQQSALIPTLKLVIDLTSSAAQPSTFAIDTQQLVNLNQNGHKSSVSDCPSLRAFAGASAVAVSIVAAAVVSKTITRMRRDNLAI